MAKSKVLFLCSCIVLSSFIVAESRAQQVNKPSQISNPQTKQHNENGFLDIFRPIANVFKRLFYRNQISRSYPPEIKNVYLSQTIVFKKNSKRRPGAVCSETDQSIIVTTDAVDESVLLYNYKVSGGEIIGKDSAVVWSLSNVKPGVYTIQVSVDDGCPYCSKPVTKQVEVIECESPFIPETTSCPTGEVVANQSNINEEQTVTFTANLKDFKGEPIFQWEVLEGEIISVQGTQTIKVRVPSEGAGKTIKAYATIKNVDPSCSSLAASVEVTKP